MRSSLTILLICIATTLFSQSDSLREQKFQDVFIYASGKKEIAYKNSRYYITDFHIDNSGTYVLLKRFGEYFLYSLDYMMEPEIEMPINFHPKGLFADCMGRLHIMTKDSLLMVKKIDNELKITERESIDKYTYYYKDCKASTSEALVFQSDRNYSQVTEYYQIGKFSKMTSELYRIADSTNLKSIKDTQDEFDQENDRLARKYGQDQFKGARYYEDQERLNTSNQSTSQEIRSYLDRKQFFLNVAIRPKYNPVFVKNDTIFIFDHLNDERVQIDKRASILDKDTIQYHYDNKWKGELHLDEERDRFYSVREIHGAQIFCLLSDDGKKIVKESKITRHPYPEKVIVYNGYAYYVYRQHYDDNLNKLFRQKL